VPPGSDAVAVVVLDTLAAPADPGLDRAAGAGAAQDLRSETRAIARRWAARIAPGRAYEATSAAAAVAALGDHAGPVVLVAPDVPALGDAHAADVLADLRAGAGVIVGSAHDGRPYLVAFADAPPAVLERAGDGWEALMAAAAERGLSVAMIRHERRLVSAGDARALALDPLAPPALVARLGRLRPTTDGAP
jgi:CTP:molybdopterin cytidylyltransferase MocA